MAGSFDKYIAVGKDTQALALEKQSGFTTITDASMAKSAFLDAYASSSPSGNDPLGSLIGANSSLASAKDFSNGAFSKMSTTMADGRALIKGTMKAPSELMEKAKGAMFGAATSLKASFNTLPKAVQAAIVGDTGVLNPNKSFRLPGFGVSNSYGNFYNKIVSGDYVLNPRSFKMDVRNLSSFTKSALKNGIFDSVLNLGLSLSGKPGSISSILTKVAFGTVLAKNYKGLLKMGISMGNAGASTLPMSAGKTLLVRKVFTDMKMPRVSYGDLNTLHTEMKATSSVLDRASLSNNGVVSASAMMGGSPLVKRIMTWASKGDAPISATIADMNNIPQPNPDKIRAVTIVASTGLVTYDYDHPLSAETTIR